MTDLGGGLVLRPATQADIDYVHAHLREGDRLEHAFDEKGEDTVERLPGVQAVVLNGRIIGYIGSLVHPYETPLSPRRVVYYLSTVHADERRLTYVRRARDVLRAVVGELPSWVVKIDTVSMPEAYPMACKWLERVLGFRKDMDYRWRGSLFRLYHILRKDI